MSLVMVDNRLPTLRQSIDELGYGILPGYIDAQTVSLLVNKIKDQAKVVIEAYGFDASDNSCKSSLDLGKHLDKSPPGWFDPLRSSWRLPFGAIDKIGWIKALGSGRMFDGEDFLADGLCERVQELCRPVFAFLHGVAEHELTRFAERVSVKPGASPKLPAHIDGNRRGSYQAIICLSVTSFLVFPYSHKAHFLPRTNRYYKLSSDDIMRLGSEFSSYETFVPANVGDVVFFIGGDFVHGSVAVRAKDPTRYVAYAQFWPTIYDQPASAFDNVEHIERKSNAADVDDDCHRAKISTRKRRKKAPTIVGLQQ